MRATHCDGASLSDGERSSGGPGIVASSSAWRSLLHRDVRYWCQTPMFTSGLRLEPCLRLCRILLNACCCFICSVCLGELPTGIANASPSLPSWSAFRDHDLELFDSIPPARLVNPDAQVRTDAGVVAGVLARTQGFQRHQRKECLNDALIYLTAAKAGLPVLTADNHQFDLIQQLAPEGQFIHF
jgi:predicted nucleic acid-binding protein